MGSSRRTFPILALASMGILVPAAVSAQTYTMMNTSVAFQDITALGATIHTPSSTDDGEALVALPFDFPFFGTVRPLGTMVGIQTNGTMNLGGSSTAYQNTVLPDPAVPNGIIAGFWTDLELGTGTLSSIASGSIFAVQWTDVRLINSTDTITFQIGMLSSGEIQISFGPRTGAISSGAATIGVENNTGMVGVGAVCNPTCVFDDAAQNTAVVFMPSATGGFDLTVRPAMAIPPTVPEDTLISLPFIVTNSGTAQSPATQVDLFLNTMAPPFAGTSIGTEMVPALAGGATHSGMFELMTAAGSAGQTVYLGLRVDSPNTAAETDESNNDTDLGAITITGGNMGTITVTTMLGDLPVGQVAVPYAARINATGSPNPSFVVSSGTLPPGINLATDGTLSGTPATAGNYPFAVTASEMGYTMGTANLQIDVSADMVPLSVVMSAPPTGVVGTAYSFGFSASGGTPPYTWALPMPANAPPGLTLGSDGTLGGTPTTAGTFMFEVRVTDGVSASASSMVTVTVSEMGTGGPPRITVGDRIELRVNSAINRPLTADGGTPPYSWATTSGGLPAGLSIMDGAIRGTATSTGTAMVGLTVTDSVGQFASKDVAIAVTITGGITTTGRSGGRGGSSGCACTAAESRRTALTGGWMLLLWFAFRRRR